MSFTGPPPDLIQDEDGVVWIQPLGGVTQFGGHYENLEDVLAESYDSAGASREYPSRRPGTTGSGPYTGGSWRPSRDAPNYNFNREPHPRVSGDEGWITKEAWDKLVNDHVFSDGKIPGRDA